MFALSAADLDVYPFAGPGAAAAALARLDQLRADPAVVQLFITCRDAAGWRVVVRPIRRTARGDWQPARMVGGD